MKITIIGASAGIGLETVKRGLNRNHTMTTLSRSEIKIEEKKSLKVILGDATNKADLLNSIQSADAGDMCFDDILNKMRVYDGAT